MAFLYQNETQEEGSGSHLLRFESIDSRWFLWTIRRLGLRKLGIALEAALGGQTLQQGYAGLSDQLRIELYEAHLRYMALMTHVQDPAPVSLMEAMVSQHRLAEELIQEGSWYSITLKRGWRRHRPRPPRRDDEVIYTSIGTAIDLDGPLMGGMLNSIKILRKWMQVLLQGLHFPQNNPVQAAVLAAMPGVPPVNPMVYVPGHYQPFVGANLVGAANNLALYGADGKVIAYVDYGLPALQNENTYPVTGNDPCSCVDAAMILSHWDYDHYAMVRRRPDALRRRWLAPQQVFGSVAARELYARLLNETPNGAELTIWLAGAGAHHVVTDFGFIERATGGPVNDDGLAVYVRVRDDPTAIPTATALSMFAPRAAPAAAPLAWTGMVLNQPLIVNGGLAGEWVNSGLGAPFNGNLVAVAAGSHPSLPAALAAGTPAGTLGQVIGGGSAYWMPATAAWAISAADFVHCGGMILDFPPGAHPRQHMLCVSPTPGSGWDLAAPPAAVAGVVPLLAGGWQPVWGAVPSCWAAPLPSAAAAGLLPLPAGPMSLLPTAGLAPVTPDERYVLLPGDAGFQYLPSMAAWSALSVAMAAGGPVTFAGLPHVVGIVASHHGSDSWIPQNATAAAALRHIPPAPGGVAWPPTIPADPAAKIVYSYGTRLRGLKIGDHCYRNANGYGHPRPNAIAAYEAAGWAAAPSLAGFFDRLNTAPSDYRSMQGYDPLILSPGTPVAIANLAGHFNGNVALGWSDVPKGPLATDIVPLGAPVAAFAGQVGPQPLHRICPGCNQVRNFYF